eukprot:comp14249_c0_seq1/m.10235 comp14249_c0_seq1/g.10235  ORF comp14249_c0_seq1/g.10235 comp14249_c0_seq1/m.10235 type:complete len:416 (-) comp14249_c0_seq1:252-1499(-)
MHIPCKVRLISQVVGGVPTQNTVPAKAVVVVTRGAVEGGGSQRKVQLLVCTAATKQRGGAKLLLQGNVQQLKYDGAEGRVSLQLKQPPKRLIMEGDAVKLRTFTALVQKVVQSPSSVADTLLSPCKYLDPNTPETQTKMVFDAKRELPTTYPPKLTHLTITGKALRSIPPAILTLNQITYLELPDNKITQLPENFASAFPALAALKLPRNRLEEFPMELCGMNIQILDLSGNRITHLPSQLCRMSRLFQLTLDNNRISTLPANIDRLKSLRRLSMQGNCIEVFPSSIRHMNLERFDASGNPFRLDETANRVAYRTPFPIAPLRELAAKVLIKTEKPIETLYLPLDLEGYLLGADVCAVCRGAGLETSKLFVCKYDVSATAGMIGLHATWANMVPVAGRVCSVQCMKKRFGTKSVR